MVVKSFLALTIHLKIVNGQVDCQTNSLVKVFVEFEIGNRFWIGRKGQECVEHPSYFWKFRDRFRKNLLQRVLNIINREKKL